MEPRSVAGDVGTRHSWHSVKCEDSSGGQSSYYSKYVGQGHDKGWAEGVVNLVAMCVVGIGGCKLSLL